MKYKILSDKYTLSYKFMEFKYINIAYQRTGPYTGADIYASQFSISIKNGIIDWTDWHFTDYQSFLTKENINIMQNTLDRLYKMKAFV